MLGISKGFNNSVGIAEEISFGKGKSFTDGLNVAESISRSLNKVISDSLNATDDFDGTATAEDDQEFHFGKIVQQTVTRIKYRKTIIRFNSNYR